MKDVLKILDIEPVIISNEKLENFGSKDYILYKVKQELTNQFDTYIQNILELIKRYLEDDYNTNNFENTSFVGINSFNLFWDDVRSVVAGDCINKTMKETRLFYSKNTKQSALISDVISKPKWTHTISGISHTSLKTMIPDIVTIKDNKLSIYDAKYYKIKLDEKELKSQPEVGDLTKQYLYE